MNKLHELFLTFFYFGNSKIAPGTVGSAATVGFWLCVTTLFVANDVNWLWQTSFWVIFCIFSFYYGVFASPLYMKYKKSKTVDQKSIVLDEVVGQIIALQIGYLYLFEGFFIDTTITSYHLSASFILFRFFDIYKPSIIGTIDKNLKCGLGVMLDDVIAGLAAGFVVLIGWWVIL